MKNSIFYGSSEIESVSYLEFGSIDFQSGKKNIWDFRLHEKAYDWLMHARYSNDIYAYLKMKDLLDQGAMDGIFNLYNSEIHHKDDASCNLGKLLALLNVKKTLNKETLSFFEIGQTLFGCIDAMEFYQSLLKNLTVEVPTLDLSKVHWFGVDISSFFNRLCKVMHAQYIIEAYEKLSDLSVKSDVFFAKGVTMLYACDSIKRVFELLDKGRLCVFDYSFSLEKTEEVIIGTGKKVRYLLWDDFKNEMQSRKEVLYVKKSGSSFNSETGRLWLDCIYAEENLCKSYIEMDMKIRKDISGKLSSFSNSERFLNIGPSEWLSIYDYLEYLKI